VKNVIGYVGDIINRTLADCLEILAAFVGRIRVRSSRQYNGASGGQTEAHD